MTANRETSEDLTQEIFIRVFQKLPQFNFQASFATWFYRLALNHCLNYARRRATPPQAIDELPEPSLNGAMEDGIFQEQLQSHIHKALLTLKPKLRLILILKDIEGLSYAEVAERLELSEGTVASRLNRARKVLALKLTHLRGTV
jgi:RNA polymerase sigma-70 factor (ECF subfamily)